MKWSMHYMVSKMKYIWMIREMFEYKSSIYKVWNEVCIIWLVWWSIYEWLEKWMKINQGCVLYEMKYVWMTREMLEYKSNRKQMHTFPT